MITEIILNTDEGLYPKRLNVLGLSRLQLYCTE